MDMLESCLQTCMTYISADVQWKTPDDGQKNCPKHAEFLDKNKLGKISASVGFITKKFVTMQHGHMNVKFRELRHGVHHLQSRKPARALTGVVSVGSSHTRVTVKLH
jgi:hypothetical protein